jgi:uncharacterized membrane protein required for colicin V production
MLLDILIIVPMIIFTLLGLRDGVVRKLVAIVFLIIGLFLGQHFMHDIGQFLSDNGWIHSDDASMYGFLFIFLGTAILQGLLYKILAKGYKIGGLADRVGGLIFGFIEGALFLSCLLFILAVTGFPSREIRRDARTYKPIVNIAPQILDLTSLIESESIEKLQEAGKAPTVKGYGQGSGPKSIDSAAVIEARKQNEHLNKTREALRKINQ